MRSEDFERELSEFSRKLDARATVVDDVEHFLREMITSGNLKSGERVVETRIARQLGIGQPAVREALKTLEAEGLIVRQPNRGCSVVKLSPTEVDQIFVLRQAWETMAVEMAMDKGVEGKTGDLTKALENLLRAAEGGDPAKFYACDLQFHKAIWRLAQNPFLEKALSQITVPLFSFVMIKVATEHEFDLKRSAAEHERITRAILSGNKQNAVNTVREAMTEFWKSGDRIMEQQNRP